MVKVVKKLIQVQKRHDNKEIKDELKEQRALKIVAGHTPTDRLNFQTTPKRFYKQVWT